LKPEKSESFELGVQYSNKFLSVSGNGFYEKGRNLIDWVKDDVTDSKWKATNLTAIDKTGFEANVAIALQELLPQLSTTRLNLGYMYLYQTRDAETLISKYVLDYLRHKFTAGLAHPIYKGLTADWQFRWQQREGDAYSSFSLLDVKLNWKQDDWNIYLSANNLFNVSYCDLLNIPQPGFWFSGGVSRVIW
jgi:iron complex outermembrane receptor protein